MRSLACLVVAGLLAVPASGADLSEIRAAGRLRVVAGSQGPSAFERDLLEGFARLQGLKVEIVAVKSRDEQIPALLRAEADLALGLVDTERLRKQIALTGEVLPARQVVVTARPHETVSSIDELRAERVGVVRGSVWAQAALEAGVPPDQVEPYADIEPTLAALHSGEVTATVVALCDYALAARVNPNLEAGLILGSPGRMAWGLRKADVHLQAALDEYLTNVRRTPTWSRLVVEHFGERALAVLGKQ